MAEQDKKQWVDLLKKLGDYQSTASLRKRKDYGRKIALWEAIEIATETDSPFFVTTIFPFGDSKDLAGGVTIFPQTMRFDKNHVHELDEPILYDGESLTIEQFITKCPALEIATIPMLDAYTCSLAVFLMTTEEHNKFKKTYMLPVRKKATHSSFVPETRGKNKYVPDWKNEMKQFILQHYKKIGKKAIPVQEIRDAWKYYADTKLSNKVGVTAFISESTIRRILAASIKE